MTTVADHTPNPTRAPGDHRVLVDPKWLAGHLQDANVQVVEVDVGSAAYDAGHIDGAVLWNVYQDLKDSDYRTVDPARLEELLARSGIGASTTVVFYGYAPAMGFWLMKLYGHRDVRILDCSRDAWRVDGRPWSTDAPSPSMSAYQLGDEDPNLRAALDVVRGAIDRPGVALVDVRSAAEYHGDRFWPSGAMEPGGSPGHIPSAVHQPIDGLYDDRGGFRPAADLRRVFWSVDLESDEEELITYCTIGGRAATAWFALTYLLGRGRVRVYDGSWAEWGRTPGTPIEAI